MIHARKDYQRFQDPENKIGQDEPVLLFRAQDKHFIEVLVNYKEMLLKDGNTEIAECIKKHIQLSLIWRANNKVKRPDL